MAQEKNLEESFNDDDILVTKRKLDILFISKILSWDRTDFATSDWNETDELSVTITEPIGAGKIDSSQYELYLYEKFLQSYKEHPYS